MRVVLLTPGTVFAADFRIERPLAEGGMGAVYIAEQLSTGQRRALKVMQPQLLPDQRSWQRFLEEARIGSRIESEHVVQVVAAGVDAASGIPWLAMELLDGVDLANYVSQRGPLPPMEALELLEQTGHALGEAHVKGIIHRDLKPENLFLARTRRRGAEQTVKILDFGIAQTIAASRAAATVTSAIGSPLWMAPEQAQPGAMLRPATDVWSLGLIAFHLLTGKLYWLSANHPAELNLTALLVEVMTQELDPANRRAVLVGANVSLPFGFDAWFARCVVRDPAQRFPDAGVAIRELRAALTGAPAMAFAPTVPQPYTPAPVQVAAPSWPQASHAAPAPQRSGIGIPLALAAFVAIAISAAGLAMVFSLSGEENDVPPPAARPVALGPPPAAPMAPILPPAPPPAPPPGPPENDALDPAPGPPPGGYGMAGARECMLRGDNGCAIRALEGHAESEQELAMLIEAYRARGDRENATRHMRAYVERFPSSSRARMYGQILARQP